jgi:UDP-2,3-diacylglucosamine pyrophosphatase LpxH
MSLHKKIEELEKQYNFSLSELLELYRHGQERLVIAEKLNLAVHSLEEIVKALKMPWKKNKRPMWYVKHMIEYNATTLDATDDATDTELNFLTKRLAIADNTIARLRLDGNQLRRELKVLRNRKILDDEISAIITKALPIKNKITVNVTTAIPSKHYRDHTSSILLSDLHVEELVSPTDVGNDNEYNWSIMTSRLDTLFAEWFNSYRGESRACIFILGDVISGIIHDVLENVTKPTAQAIHDLADLLSMYIQTAGTIFETVDVYFVSGNHERLSDRIKSNAKGFGFGYLFAQLLKAKLGSKSNIQVEISTTGYITTQIGNKVIGGHHGDQHRSIKSEARTHTIQEAFNSILGVQVDHIFEGHTHQFHVSNNTRGTNITNGSLIGSNAYGVVNGYISLRPSQTIIQFLPSGEIENIRQVFLDTPKSL